MLSRMQWERGCVVLMMPNSRAEGAVDFFVHCLAGLHQVTGSEWVNLQEILNL
jgi:hypothetical protein